MRSASLPEEDRGREAEPWDGERVADLRRRLGLSQASFARLLGVRQQTVSEWETGRYRPRGASVRVLGLCEERAPYDEPERQPP